MASQTHDIVSELARLNSAAAGAGEVLACSHESADDLHRALVRKYLSAHPLKHPLAYAAVIGLGRQPA
jgi:hypothetical protein